ncbi:MAG: CDGSH iron-sulfur domain-containing protein [Bacteroidales bacterium]|nr:MAG: CDGSH iron-sulfur domain-containing protein [Bacteroidales bacterium]
MATNERKDITEITVFSNGPLKVSGNFKLTGSNLKLIETGNEIYLCRCGGSANKPFCDGTHKKIGINDKNV